MRGFFSFEAWLKLGFGFCYMAYQVQSSYMLYVCVLYMSTARKRILRIGETLRERSSGVKTERNIKNGGSRGRGGSSTLPPSCRQSSAWPSVCAIWRYISHITIKRRCCVCCEKKQQAIEKHPIHLALSFFCFSVLCGPTSASSK